MSALLAMLADSEDIYLEPSALAGMYGPVLCSTQSDMKAYADHISNPSNATHIVWATGGRMVPSDEMEQYYREGKANAEKLM